MKTLIIGLLAFMITASSALAQNKAGKTDKNKHSALYSCPKHPEYTGHKAGKCPKCGMELNISAKQLMKEEVTKNYVCPSHQDVVKHDPGKCPICGKKLNLTNKEQMKAEVVKVYTCPMHSEAAFDEEGKCPKCGKALVEKIKK
jgi:transcription initiation factor IIE alpha subunit